MKIAQTRGFSGAAAIKSVTRGVGATRSSSVRTLQAAFTSLAESPFVKMSWFPDPPSRDRGAARRPSVSARSDDDDEDEGFGDVFNDPEESGQDDVVHGTAAGRCSWYVSYSFYESSGMYADGLSCRSQQGNRPRLRQG